MWYKRVLVYSFLESVGLGEGISVYEVRLYPPEIRSSEKFDLWRSKHVKKRLVIKRRRWRILIQALYLTKRILILINHLNRVVKRKEVVARHTSKVV